MDCLTALLTVLDQVDYTRGACSPTEMVGAVLPKEVIALARQAIEKATAPKCLCPADGHSELCPIHKVNSSPR